MEFIFCELEWHTDDIGRNVVVKAVRSIFGAVEEAVNIYSPEALDYSGPESALWFSVGFNGQVDPYWVKRDIVEATGYRVKTIGKCPEHIAATDYDTLMEWWSDDLDS